MWKQAIQFRTGLGFAAYAGESLIGLFKIAAITMQQREITNGDPAVLVICKRIVQSTFALRKVASQQVGISQITENDADLLAIVGRHII